MTGKLKNFIKRLGKWFWVILVIAAIIIWRVIATGNTSVKVQLTQVSQGDLVQTVSTSGTIMADQYTQLTFPAGGKILYVDVKPGQKVKKGQAIAGIDTVALNAAYQNAANDYRNTQAAVDYEHDQDKNYGSAETFLEKSTRTAAEVANDDAYNNYLAAQDNLKNANIYAPFNGVMDTVSPSSPGENVVAGSANYTIINPDTVYMDAEVEETDLPNVAVGQTVNIVLDAYPDQTFTGSVTNIGLVAFTSSTGGNAYHVRITLPPNDNLRFKVGMQGDTNIVYNTTRNAVKVSTTALVSENDKNYVWEVENGRAKKVEVQIGGASDTETEITSGLGSGQSVIDNPPANLVNGGKVSS
jgi:RND family efflux transporter MFP subunit